MPFCKPQTNILCLTEHHQVGNFSIEVAKISTKLKHVCDFSDEVSLLASIEMATATITAKATNDGN